MSTLRAAGCVFADDEAAMLIGEARSADELLSMVERRAAGEPIEYIVGWAEFDGLRMIVAPGVFVPRLRSEHLLAAALTVTCPGMTMLEVCCGCAPVSAALARRVARLEIHAADIDPVATGCARANVPSAASISTGDLFDPLPDGLCGRVDLLVANAPYVPTDAIALLPAEARDHELRAALDGGADGLDVQRRIALAAHDWLAPGGHLIVETSRDQAERTSALLAGAGLSVRTVRDEEFDATVVIGRRAD